MVIEDAEALDDNSDDDKITGVQLMMGAEDLIIEQVVFETIDQPLIMVVGVTSMKEEKDELLMSDAAAADRVVLPAVNTMHEDKREPFSSKGIEVHH